MVSVGSGVVDLIAQQRQRLIDREARLFADYSNAYNGLSAELRAQADAIVEAAGGDLAVAMPDIAKLGQQASNGIYSVASAQGPGIDAQSRLFAVMGGNDAAIRMAAAFAVERQAAVSSLLTTNFGRPAATDLLRALSDVTGRALQDSLIQSVVIGRSPLDAARYVQDIMGSSLSRAQTIARTELMTAYRGSSLQTYRDNLDVVTGWVWVTTEGACLLCFAMEGEEFALEDDFDTHPNCRCSAAPLTRGQTASDFVTTADDQFAAMDEADQRDLLGPSRYDLWEGGQVASLKDFTGTAEDPIYGTTRTILPLSDLPEAA